MSATPFLLSDELPSGRLAIEASAGTGKTFALAALAARFVAERDVRAAELLLVTFTRAAAAELRDRVRARFVEAAHALAGSADVDSTDALVRHLASRERPERARRLARAVTEFDAATITTIHGFAWQVLGTLGAAGATDPDAVLVDGGRDETAAACADVLAWASTEERFAGHLPDYDPLVKITGTAKAIGDLDLVPAWGEAGAPTAARVLAELVRRSLTTMRDRRRRSGTLSFDDVLAELRDAIAGPAGATVLATLRQRYRVALIDEFQDTDPVQWAVFAAAFAGPATGTALVLVGDPKQSIYSFRGADVATYVGALTEPGTVRRSLSTNWRSDGRLLHALEVLFEGATFGADDIAFSRVDAAPELAAQSLRHLDGTPWVPLAVRLAVGEDLERKQANAVPVGEADRAITSDLVAEVVRLLDGALVPDPSCAPDGGRPLQPSDIAVLVHRNADAEQIQAALRRAGVPAVLVRGTSVLGSEAARHWRWLLEALLRPTDPRRARTAAMSWFVGWTADEVAQADEGELVALQSRLGAWLEALAHEGVDRFVSRVLAESEAVARVLRRPDGDRAATDLGHVGDLLRDGASGGGSSVAALLAVLDAPPEPAVESDIEANVLDRRVETESASVQIMTVWVAKGLEFPVVCCPTLWRPPSSPPVLYPVDGRRTYDVANGDRWPDPAAAAGRKAIAQADAEGEALRLAYVALTRARHATVVWWTRASSADASPLTRLLFARRPDGSIDPGRYGQSKVRPPDDADLTAALQPLVDAAAGCLSVAVHGHAPLVVWRDPLRSLDRPALATARFDVHPDRTTARWSFTALSDGGLRSAAGPADEGPGGGGATDEGPDPVPVPDAPAPVAPRGTPLSQLAGGTAFGILVHAVLEDLDFAAGDPEAAIRDALRRQLRRRGAGVRDVHGDDGTALLVEGLAAVLATPLGAPFGGRRLCDVARTDRIDEMGFDLPLGGPAAATVRAIGAVLRHHLPDDDPLAAWSEHLGTASPHPVLRGHLTGSIDLVVRVRGPQGPRFVVVDYKTNQLTPWGAAAAPHDYDRAHLALAMEEHDYGLQALLYSVALHRYLRWRLADYEPAVHLGGAAYLFLRGMTGPSVPVVGGHADGVFDWAVPPAAVVAVSDLLAGCPTVTAGA